MILLTGGLGYIGSHLAAALMAGGHEVILVDNLSNARMEMLERLEFMAGRYVTFFRLDIRNTPALQKIFEQYAITAVVHCAGMKATTDSAMQPLDYYNANVGGTMSLLRVMQRTGVRNLVYGSSATVYGNPTALPVSESAALNPLTPYANSNRMCEDVLRDLVTAEGDWRIAILRYFSVAGAHPSAVIGEWPSGIASNLMPYLAQVAREQRTHLEIFGNDYDTPDGTGVRDYIHVMDVVDGHMQALHWLFNQPQQAFDIFNLGRGEGVSVKQMLDAFEAVSGRRLPHEVVQRRQGDAAAVYADVSRARELLGFEAKRNVHDMAKDMWTFYQTLT
jgi:UDP-glucose 4-epimerase